MVRPGTENNVQPFLSGTQLMPAPQQGVELYTFRLVNILSEVQNEKGWQSALAMENVSDSEIRYFSGRQGLKNSDHPAILLADVSEVLISESRATEGCGTFIHVQGEKSNEITIRNNSTKKAGKELSFENNRLKRL